MDPATLGRRERLLLAHLERAYTPCIAEDVLKPLLTQSSTVSLRALDWAVTNWAKEHNVVCTAVTGGTTNVHHAYLSALSHWKRRLFDPFRRRDRVQVRIGGELLETTLGQANYALWCYQTGVLSYVMGHRDEIEAHMNAAAQRQKRERREAIGRGERLKRAELTLAPAHMCVAYIAPREVQLEEQ